VHAQTMGKMANEKAVRTEPIQFEQHKDSIFGMNDLLSQPQKKQKRE